jgi:ribonuclease BN (tRNA processing enzyme)
MSLKVTVCGSSGGYAGAGKACAGFLLSTEDDTLMVDIGAGSLSNMLKYLEADQLGGLAVTHMHYYHYSDIYGLCTARRFWETALPPLPVVAPGNAIDVISSPLAEKSRPEFARCMDMMACEPGVPVDVAGFTITAEPSAHVVEGLIFRIEAEDRTICYSGDTERCDALLELARGSDLFICESTFTSEVPLAMGGHMTAAEAGKVATEAAAGSLLLTHLWPTLDPERAIEDAAGEYAGPVDLAVEGLTLFVGPYPCAT